MNRFILGLAFATVACAQYTEYSQPLQSVNDDLSSSIEYLAPAQHEENVLADDGYRYKTLRRLRYRKRRDVSELNSAEYLPPHQEVSTEYAEQSISSLPSFQDQSSGYEEPASSYLAPVEQQQTELADDGYRYKTVRRLRHRQRRDVSELASAQYLPPQQELSSEYAEQTSISPDSYQEVSSGYEEPSSSYLAPVEQQQTELADDGYRYKTVRRLRHRQRRDVNELSSAEYLPPHQELSTEYAEQTNSSPDSYQELSSGYEEPSSSYLAPVEQQQTELADDGYRYKTVRRLRHRQRRDVNELSSAEYLPPHQELSTEYAEQTSFSPDSYQEVSSGYEEPASSYLAPVEQQQTELSDDGYRYKTVRRLRHRQRRDVSELSSAEYLPPHQEPSTEYAEQTNSSPDSYQELSSGYEEPATSYLAPVEQQQTELADDGYRYKTVRRLRHRQRRDVNELSSAEYLPPHQELSTGYAEQTSISPNSYQEVSSGYEEPSSSYLAPVEQQQTELADDGYRYKTVRRLRHRQRRDVSELSSAEYLPPHQELSTEYAEQTSFSPDSYQEVSSGYEEQLPASSYLAPAEQQQTELADDGYRYKTVRKFKVYRH